VARLAAKQQTGIALLFHYIIANNPSMARLRNAARAIFDPLAICKREGLARYHEDALYRPRYL